MSSAVTSNCYAVLALFDGRVHMVRGQPQYVQFAAICWTYLARQNRSPALLATQQHCGVLTAGAPRRWWRTEALRPHAWHPTRPCQPEVENCHECNRLARLCRMAKQNVGKRKAGLAAQGIMTTASRAHGLSLTTHLRPWAACHLAHGVCHRQKSVRSGHVRGPTRDRVPSWVLAPLSPDHPERTCRDPCRARHVRW